jgi:hypothetical protein
VLEGIEAVDWTVLVHSRNGKPNKLEGYCASWARQGNASYMRHTPQLDEHTGEVPEPSASRRSLDRVYLSLVPGTCRAL